MSLLVVVVQKWVKSRGGHRGGAGEGRCMGPPISRNKCVPFSLPLSAAFLPSPIGPFLQAHCWSGCYCCKAKWSWSFRAGSDPRAAIGSGDQSGAGEGAGAGGDGHA